MSHSRNRILALGLSGLLAIGIVGGTTAAFAAPGDAPRPGAGTERPDGGAERHGVQPIKFTVKVIAETCGLTREELKAGFRNGLSINQIIEGKGGNPADCKAAVLAKANARLQAAVDAGKITAEQKAAALVKADAALTRLMAAVPQRGNAPAAQ